MRTLPLEASAFALLNSNGDGAAVLQPLTAGETWHVTRMTVQCNSSIANGNIPEIRVYRRFISPTTMIDSSYDGNLNTSQCDEFIGNGEQIIAVWTGGDANATGTFVVAGERKVLDGF